MIEHFQDSPRIEFMKVETVAAELHQTREHVIYLLRQGRLPGVKLGRKWLIPKEEFRRHLYDLLQNTLGTKKDPNL